MKRCIADVNGDDVEARRLELVEKARKIADERITQSMHPDEKMNAFEGAMMELLDVQIYPPIIGTIGTLAGSCMPKPTEMGRVMMGDDPRLPKMPDKPTLIDFFKCRFELQRVGCQHLLQSAKLAMSKGCDEPTILACLLHDISVVALIRSDHGHWGAQLIEPYVTPEITWAVKYHQNLRFKPDPKYEYVYPAQYKKLFGEDYVPPAHVKKEWDYCQTHPWYDLAMQVVVNDFYAFNPNLKVEIEEFEGIIDRNFRQPSEGLGFDGSPSAHMWRTIIWPNSFL